MIELSKQESLAVSGGDGSSQYASLGDISSDTCKIVYCGWNGEYETENHNVWKYKVHTGWSYDGLDWDKGYVLSPTTGKFENRNN